MTSIGSCAAAPEAPSASSRVEQSYELILQDRFLLGRTKTVSNEETHEDWEIVSYDRVRGKVMLRQFVSEGCVKTNDSH